VCVFFSFGGGRGRLGNPGTRIPRTASLRGWGFKNFSSFQGEKKTLIEDKKGEGVLLKGKRGGVSLEGEPEDTGFFL